MSVFEFQYNHRKIPYRCQHLLNPKDFDMLRSVAFLLSTICQMQTILSCLANERSFIHLLHLADPRLSKKFRSSPKRRECNALLEFDSTISLSL